jgi:hypothetical protein
MPPFGCCAAGIRPISAGLGCTTLHLMAHVLWTPSPQVGPLAAASEPASSPACTATCKCACAPSTVAIRSTSQAGKTRGSRALILLRRPVSSIPVLQNKCCTLDPRRTNVDSARVADLLHITLLRHNVVGLGTHLSDSVVGCFPLWTTPCDSSTRPGRTEAVAIPRCPGIDSDPDP